MPKKTEHTVTPNVMSEPISQPAAQTRAGAWRPASRATPLQALQKSDTCLSLCRNTRLLWGRVRRDNDNTAIGGGDHMTCLVYYHKSSPSNSDSKVFG